MIYMSEPLYKDLVERLINFPKLCVKLVLNVDTGNIPYKHIFHEVYIPEDVRKFYQLCGVDGFLSEPPYGPIGDHIDILYRGLTHMCSHQELYLNGKVYQPMAYRKAVTMLASLIYECQKFPKACLETHYLEAEVNIVS